MTKQKKGFWLFIFSLIPGAGEMYMGFKKQGLSIMAMFWMTIALATGLNFGWLLMLLPILWFYSFFNVHNLKVLTEEEFYNVEDDFILHFDKTFKNSEDFIEKYRKVIALFLIVIGASILWNGIWDILRWMLPAFLSDVLWSVGNIFPQIILAVLVIWIGVHLIKGKKKELEMHEEA